MEACIEISYSRKKGYLLLYNLNVFFNIWFKKLKRKKKRKEKEGKKKEKRRAMS